MELLQLYYFKKIAEAENMTKAAKELHVAQPSLSKTIKSLEEELGYELFFRNDKYMHLNGNGKIFLKYANKIMETLDNAIKEIQLNKIKTNSTVDIIMNIEHGIQSELCSEFVKTYPEAEFNIRNNQFFSTGGTNTSLIFDWSFEEINTGNTVTLVKENINIALPANHPLADRKAIKLEDLKNENFIIQTSKYQEMISVMCSKENFTPKSAIENDDYFIVPLLIMSGIGIAFIPDYSWGKIPGDIKLVKISSPHFSRYITFSWSDNMSYVSTLFKDFVLYYYSKYSHNNQRFVI